MITARRLSEMLLAGDPSIVVTSIFSSVESVVEWIRKNGTADLIFMDIRLEDDIAFRIFEQVNLTIPVVFTTAYDEYVLPAFQANGIDYLLKPVDEAKLNAAITKYKMLRTHFTTDQHTAILNLISKSSAYKDRFMVTIGTRSISYEANDVAYFYVNDKITYLTSTEGLTAPLNHSLEWLEAHIDPSRFYRVNRQVIIAYGAIAQGVNQNGRIKLEVTPAPRFDIFVSGDRITGFREWFGK